MTDRSPDPPADAHPGPSTRSGTASRSEPSGEPRVRIRILDGPLDPALLARNPEGAGSVLSFQGVVRPNEAGDPIVGLRYETYDPMAESMLRALAERVVEAHGLSAIRVLHSRGFVGVGLCSFQLDVASPHRKESLAAMDTFITRMKEEVPIWKHPVHPGSDPTPPGPSGSPTPLADPREALASLMASISPVETEAVPLEHAAGRILGQEVRADRDNPPADVSAMDGFAIRHVDLGPDPIPVDPEAEIGTPIRTLEPGRAMKIFTGAPIPRGADLVIRREDVDEEGGGDQATIRLRVDPGSLNAGLYIRRRGENGRAGDRVLSSGRAISPPIHGALAAFGVANPLVHRRVRVAVLVTGNEIVDASEEPGPTQIRDSNGWALHALLDHPWIERVSRGRVGDDPGRTREALAGALETADVVLLTGGVSMGDHDYVPGAIEAVGGEIRFHRIGIKPGKPLLGATAPGGRLVFGLPGNPVSVLATGRRFALPALARRAGVADAGLPSPGWLELEEPVGKAHPLTRYLPVVVDDRSGRGRVLATRGSGDLVGVASSHGLVEVARGRTGRGPYPYFPWG